MVPITPGDYLKGIEAEIAKLETHKKLIQELAARFTDLRWSTDALGSNIWTSSQINSLIEKPFCYDKKDDDGDFNFVASLFLEVSGICITSTLSRLTLATGTYAADRTLSLEIVPDWEETMRRHGFNDRAIAACREALERRIYEFEHQDD